MGAEGRVTRRCSLLSRHIQDLQADGLFCICLEVYTTSGAFPAFVVLPAVAGHAVLFGVLHQGAAVFHILCYVILSMRLEAPFGWFVHLYYTTWSPPVSFFGFHCSIWIVALHSLPPTPTLPLAQGRFILYNMFFGENSFCKEGA